MDTPEYPSVGRIQNAIKLTNFVTIRVWLGFLQESHEPLYVLME